MTGERIALGIHLQFGVQGIKTPQIRPTDAAGHNAYAVASFENRIVDADIGHAHHFLEARQKTTSGIGALVQRGSLKNGFVQIRGIVLQFFQVNPCFETKNTCIPIVSPGIQVGLGGCLVRFFFESRDDISMGLNVPKASFGIGRLDSKGHQKALFSQFRCLFYSLAIGFTVPNQMIGGGDKDDAFGIQGVTSHRDGRGRITTNRLQDIRRRSRACLPLGQSKLSRVGHDEVSRTEILVTFQGILKKGSPMNEGQILLGHTEPRQRPQARSAPTR